jgi:hypothetical protein
MMVAKGFGSKDSDKVGKEKSDKPGLKASTKVATTGQIGGTSNRTTPPSATKGAAGYYPKFKRGGGVKRGR